MTISMYQAAVPTVIRTLNNLAAVLEKAEQHAASKKIEPVALVNARLFPDMFPLAKQVQIASDTAKGQSLGPVRFGQLARPRRAALCGPCTVLEGNVPGRACVPLRPSPPLEADLPPG